MNTATLVINEVAAIDVGWFIAFLLLGKATPFSSLMYVAVFIASILAHLVLDVLQHNWAWLIFDLAALAFNAWAFMQLWKRRKRKGRLAALGNKARAKIAEMKRKMAERRARPVLRPVPQGI